MAIKRSALNENLATTLTRTTLEGWKHFMDHVSSKLDGAWLFRGVSKSSFDLRPSIGRGPAHPTLQNERDLLDRFKREARPYLNFQPQDDWEWLAIAQHHGTPTRLIDWSETPLVAAYFAVTRDDTSPAGVYVIPRPPVRAGKQRRGPFEATTVHFFYPGHVSRRITAQRGLFTVHPQPWKAYAPKGAQLFEIPASLKAEFRINLNGLGINHASIFPDIDGLSNHLAWIFRGQDRRAQQHNLLQVHKPSVERIALDPDDPQKGAWGERPIRNGWQISGKVSAEERGWYKVTLTVRATGRKTLVRPVTFHLHDSFDEPIQTVRPRSGTATLSIWAYGAFTVGCEITQDGTQLELDLSTIGGPRAFLQG